MSEVPWQGMAQVVLPHVSADEDVKDALAMQAVIKDGTWSRWWNTMAGLAVKHSPAAPEVLGVWHRRMAAALENASDSERKAMRLHASDLEDVEADPVPTIGPAGASAAATEAAEHQRKNKKERKYLKLIKVCDLQGAVGKLGAMVWLYSHMGNHITVDAREGAAFNRNAALPRSSLTRCASRKKNQLSLTTS
jgi:hypothetical protein